jgi:UDP-2,4-diacetamido-2,4,6-trideoxy-beta-L-altropyranose hydrolase
MMGLRVAFWVAGSLSVGGGHVVRSLSLADTLAKAGASCTFLVSQEALDAAPMLGRSAHQLVVTPTGTTDFPASEKFDWLVVDDYAIAAAQEMSWRANAVRIAVLDDLANRSHDCDLLLDSTPSRLPQDYTALTPPGARLLLGTAYAPLRPEFSLQRQRALARRAATAKPERLLVSFGLTDPGGITTDMVGAIAAALPDLALVVVVGPASAGRVKIEALNAPNITLHVNPPSMTALMIAADIALGAGGSTAWERACLGLPSVAVVLAENQRALAAGLEELGALRMVPSGPGMHDQAITALAALCDDQAAWRAMSRKAAQACDGLGARRFCLELCPPRSGDGGTVRLRPARASDADLIFAWQNEAGARLYSSNPDAPSRHGHDAWMTRKLADPDCVFSVVETGDAPCGVLRMDRRLDGSYIVSVLIAERVRGRGVGRAALEAGAILMQGHTLWAKIDDRNAASLRMFAKAGFAPQAPTLYRRGTAT